MSLFGRRVTPEQLAVELLRGLESGEVVFDEGERSPAGGGGDLLATLNAAAAAPTLDEARALLAKAVRTVEQLHSAELPQG
jgi:hypothetical protein